MPVAIETSGVFGRAAHDFLSELSGHIKQVTGEVSSHAYLLQRLSVAIQRSNSVCILGCHPMVAGVID